MPRDLRQSTKNSFTVLDMVTGEKVTLYHRMPATEERVGYATGCWERDGDKLVNRVAEARAQYGLAILTGFQDGYFMDGEKFISSDPAHPDYAENWKELFEETAGDLLIALGMRVFDGITALQLAAAPPGKPGVSDTPEKKKKKAKKGEKEGKEGLPPLAKS